jgi:hypothetical protein
MQIRVVGLAVAALLVSTTAIAAGVQTSADTYTRYELLPPTTHSFRIYYDVSAATEGATRYYNPIRRGSDPDVHGVYDRMSGEPLEWALVDGKDAKASGLLPDAEPDSQYIRVNLERPVPANGRGRMLIDRYFGPSASFCHKFATRRNGSIQRAADFCGLQRADILWQKSAKGPIFSVSTG